MTTGYSAKGSVARGICLENLEFGRFAVAPTGTNYAALSNRGTTMAEIRMCLTAALLTLVAGSAAAQVNATQDDWSRGTELGIIAAGATTGSEGGPMLGTTAAWEITRWVEVEGRASWFLQTTDARGFNVDLNALVNLIAKRKTTPWVGFGVGFYRASFDSVADIKSDFYLNRLTDDKVGQAVTFTDPSFRVSGGVDFIIKQHLTMRPEVSATLVRSGGNGEEIYSFGIRFGYRFEDRPITKAKGSR